MGQAISTTQFYLYGRRHFTKTGYLKHIASYTAPVQTSSGTPLGEEGSDGVESLRDKVVVITGANSGLGKEVATYAAAHGAKLYMLCRSKDRAESAKQDIVKISKNENVQVILVDVAELAQVRRAAAEIQAREPKIHALVCNAGVLLNNKTETSEGFETTFASHLLGGSYLLSQLLVPQLEAADGNGRVVFVTSGGMYNFAIPSWPVLTGQKGEYNGVNAYAYAKRGQVVLAEEQSKHYRKIKWVTAHPGWAATNAVDEAFGDTKKYLEPLREPWQGAEGVAWLLHANAKDLQPGALYLDRMVQPKHLAGPFFSEGTLTKNSPEQVNEFMAKLKEATALSS